jgi:hypothetical protein
MKHTHTIRRLVAAMTESEALGLKKKRLTTADIDHIVTDSETGVDENGNPLYILVKNAIPYEYCKAAYDVAVKAANQPVAGGSRADAAGVQMELRKRKDGSTSNRYIAPDAADSALNPPRLHMFRVTQRGSAWFQGEEPLPEDVAAYMKFLSQRVPVIDPIIDQYVTEALTAFEREAYFAAAVMLGAASEKALSDCRSIRSSASL